MRARTNIRITLVAAVILTTISGCCDSKVVLDAAPSTPLSSDLRPLQSELVTTYCIPTRAVGSVTWIDANGKKYSATTLAKNASTLMAKHGFDTAHIEWSDADEYRTLLRKARSNPLSSESSAASFHQTAVMICVDPLILAVSDSPISTSYASDGVNIAPAFRDFSERTGESIPHYSVGLPGGIVYGDRIPAGDGWITILSKGLTPEYRRVEVVVGEPISLEVPGGRIDLVRSGEMIEVIGVPR